MRGDAMTVLALNSGSSSLKFGLYRVSSSAIELLFDDTVESIGDGSAFRDQRDAVAHVVRVIAQRGLPAPAAIGHRIVHGGPALRQHCMIDETALLKLDAAIPFAPLHAPAALSVVRYALDHFRGVPQVACFDTTFHASLPDVARVLPVAKHLQAIGVQRYGFHGLSCESILHQLADDLPDRLIVAHLGNGASITAISRGKSIDTSMGMTPAGGVIMGTRSGDLDPGVLLYLLRQKHYSAEQLEDLLNHHAGLLGVSGIASDLRRLHEVAGSNADAQLALDLFASSVRKQIAAMITVLDGVDTIVFTGGIGQHDAAMRAAITDGLSWLGIHLDPSLNAAGQRAIQRSDSRCRVLHLVSDEDQQIAQHTARLVRG